MRGGGVSKPIDRLIEFVRKHQHGGCKVVSLGDGCKCPLCDLSRVNQALPERLEATAKDWLAMADRFREFTSNNKVNIAYAKALEACALDVFLATGRYIKQGGEYVEISLK